MASGVVSTTFSTATSTADRSMATLFIAETPCSDIRLSSCESPESCVVQILPSALCFDNTQSSWTIGSALSCGVTTTPLSVPVVTFPEDDCPLGMTMAKSTIQSGGNWCCPQGFTWASHSLCQSTLIPGKYPQISDACAQENTIAFTPNTTQVLKRTIETPAGNVEFASLRDIPFPVPTTPTIAPRTFHENAVTAIFIGAVYLAGQTVPTNTLMASDFPTHGPSTSAAGGVNEGENPKNGLSDLVKVAIGLASGVVGSLLILLVVILIRMHRKRRLRETAQDDIPTTPGSEGYIKVEPKSPSRARFDIARTRHKPEAVSPRELVDELIYMYFPKPERSIDKGKTRELSTGERVRSEVTSFGGTTFFSTNHFELETELASSQNEVTTKQNNRASSQVLPWKSGIWDQWFMDSSTTKKPEQEHEFI
ncbi:hypothetical protein F4678DRAFT_435044 [Xylaria arbuscula]|nr:hypothetical protein F4678DRAFT_435044 [Xylaria arbuscula]